MPPAAILDVTCGGRMLWNNKHHPSALYVDRRQEPPGTIPIRPNWCVQPQVVASFTALPFADDSFQMVIFDPPHIIRLNPSQGFLRTKYGELGADWKEILQDGFRECWRVLRPDGTLVFKWSGEKPSATAVLALFPVAPLFKCKQATSWWLFLKLVDGGPGSELPLFCEQS